MQPFAERHGLSAAMVAPTKIIAGLGASLGIEVLQVPNTDKCETHTHDATFATSQPSARSAEAYAAEDSAFQPRQA